MKPHNDAEWISDKCDVYTSTDYVTKTGRHFPQIAEVLEQMKEGNDADSDRIIK